MCTKYAQKSRRFSYSCPPSRGRATAMCVYLDCVCTYVCTCGMHVHTCMHAGGVAAASPLVQRHQLPVSLLWELRPVCACRPGTGVGQTIYPQYVYLGCAECGPVESGTGDVDCFTLCRDDSLAVLMCKRSACVRIPLVTDVHLTRTVLHSLPRTDLHSL